MGRLGEDGPVRLGGWGGAGNKDMAGCGVLIRVGRDLHPGVDVRVVSLSPSSFLLHTSPLPFSPTPFPCSPLLYCSPLPSIFPSFAPICSGLWPVGSGAEYPTSFRGCLPGVSQLIRRGEEGGGGLRCPLVRELAGGSTMDSTSTVPEAPALGRPSGPGIWAPAPTAGGSRPPPPRLLFPGGLPGSSTSVPVPPPASCRGAESPGPGLRVWRPW